ncbi:MAG: prepilin peptidase [Ilumatobacteraceae bacterium]
MQRAILDDDRQLDDGARQTDLQTAWRDAPRPARLVLLAGAGIGLAAVVAWMRDAPAVAATGLCLLILTAAALVDIVDRRLPNELVSAAALPVGVAVALTLAAGGSAIATGALAGAALVGGPLLVAHLVSPDGMGFGDVKAGSVLGAAVGLISGPVAVLALLFALAGSGGWAVVQRRRHVALGPGLVLGASTALVAARLIGVEAN